MNDEMISGLGGFCTELLSSEAFIALTKLYSQQCAVDILETIPADKDARERIYASYLGFEGFLSFAKKFAEDYASHTAEAAPPDRSDDPAVHDIYSTSTDEDTTDDPRVHDIYDGTN